jgi:hypothetical protein
MAHASVQARHVRILSQSFSLFMAIIIMALAIWALPGNMRVVLVVPVVLGAIVAFRKLRGSRTVDE